ncbi:MAG: copper amine oxidase N-terminal domain-containing protein [Paenibacillaceae bacterium]|uniref:Copper amine oxidase N-terminal domain-containing protein n=1 Tax=Paenibacillus mellifer TaxID=2937794 RepID=A0A9X1XYC0_9BACL|nr:stalk domain-containing protein [Paenibacillus mellifer]MBW4840023.1 copper amine oxidase N-terminal domain-containing protein [Paenibacillaceae bacterium]MCK8487599.1 copper amine oxidase N-terminal domain-containing protein [Paenibacillus mellifer]
MKKLILAVAVCSLLGSASVAAAAPVVKSIKATIKYFNFVVNGQTKLTADALVFNGATYVPIRDAASLFNYETKYDAATKSISFSSKRDWITLSELIAANTRLSASQSEDTPNVYVIRAGNEIAFSLNASALKDGETTSVVTNRSHLISVIKELGSVVLSKKDVIAAGYLVD